MYQLAGVTRLYHKGHRTVPAVTRVDADNRMIYAAAADEYSAGRRAIPPTIQRGKRCRSWY
jgi:hypothetical protein